METKKIETQLMTKKEIEESLRLLNQAIKENKITFEHANPIDQNCWISSSDIMGIYFPNTTLDDNDKYYRICALSKVSDALGIIKALKDDCDIPQYEEIKKVFKPYKFISFDMFLYGQHYCAIKRGIIQDIEWMQEYLNKLQKVQRVHKKDGKDFKEISKNFVGGLGVFLHFDLLGKVCNSIDVNDCRIWRDGEQTNTNPIPSINEIENLIKREIQRYKNIVMEYKKDLERLPQFFRKFERVAATLKELRNASNHWTYFAHELDYMTI